jgi:hypothetical protein
MCTGRRALSGNSGPDNKNQGLWEVILIMFEKKLSFPVPPVCSVGGGNRSWSALLATVAWDITVLSQKRQLSS